MDSITQAVLGASIQGAGLGRYQGRRAYLYGALLATVPDLDVLIRYANPVTAMTTHRSFSHSLFVLTALAGLLSLLICRYYPQSRRGYSPRRLFVVLWLVLITHPLLDSFTVYGTQLFWPGQKVPESWAAVFIIDPLYTLPLLAATLAGLGFGYRAWTQKLSTVALVLSCGYLLFGLAAKDMVENRSRRLLSDVGIEVSRLKSMPMPLTTLLWRVIAEDKQHRRYEIVVGLADTRPPEWRIMPYHPQLQAIAAKHPDYQRLKWFTDNWVDVVAEGNQLILQDERMDAGGKAYFRFVIATKDARGQWQYTPARALPKVAGGGNYQARLQQLWQRIFHAAPLPYARWHIQPSSAAQE